jgi:hypothetical protein
MLKGNKKPLFFERGLSVTAQDKPLLDREVNNCPDAICYIHNVFEQVMIF